MNSFLESKNLYLKVHLSKDLKQPQRRINALNSIENTIKNFRPDLLQNDKLFKEFNKSSFGYQYEQWKGKALSGAEKSVIKGLFDIK